MNTYSYILYVYGFGVFKINSNIMKNNYLTKDCVIFGIKDIFFRSPNLYFKGVGYIFKYCSILQNR